MPPAAPSSTAGKVARDALLRLGAATVLLASAVSQTVQAAPAAGRYDGQFCVTTTSAARQCGPAEVDLLRAGRAIVRISDVSYGLVLHRREIEVVLLHGSMQIDGFVGPYDWKGDGLDAVLRFSDAEKGVRYEVHFADRAPSGR